MEKTNYSAMYMANFGEDDRCILSFYRNASNILSPINKNLSTQIHQKLRVLAIAIILLRMRKVDDKFVTHSGVLKKWPWLMLFDLYSPTSASTDLPISSVIGSLPASKIARQMSQLWGVSFRLIRVLDPLKGLAFRSRPLV